MAESGKKFLLLVLAKLARFSGTIKYGRIKSGRGKTDINGISFVDVTAIGFFLFFLSFLLFPSVKDLK